MVKRVTGMTRASTMPQRKRKVAERVRNVDAAALRDAASRRLDALENDNFAAEQEAIALDGEDEYEPGLDSDEDMKGGTGKKNSKATKRSRKARSSSAGKTRTKSKSSKAKAGIERWNMSLTQALEEEDVSLRPKAMVLYDEITARPSTRPPRPFCSVCGYQAAYTCTRCAVRFCSVPCGNVHNETRCLKYAI